MFLRFYSELFRYFTPNVFVILLRIATENNTYLGTWRDFAWELGVKQEGVSVLTHPPLILETKYMLILNISLPFGQKS